MSASISKKRIKKAVTITVLIIIILFIWCHSAVSSDISRAESEAVGGFLTPLLELFVGKGNVTDHLVRKLAHFTEYAALGAVIAYLIHIESKISFLYISYGALCAMAISVIDESIQLFADGRGAQVKDILLDTGGILFGMLVVLCASFLFVRRKKHK